MSSLGELAQFLCPPGGGKYLHGDNERARDLLHQNLYGNCRAVDVDSAFASDLWRLPSSGVAVLGIPFERGSAAAPWASLGPLQLRVEMTVRALESYCPRGEVVVDIGDVVCVPQLLRDEMLSQGQLDRARQALYGHLALDRYRAFPVSPLSIAARCVERLHEVNPRLSLLVLGGDESTALESIASAGMHRQWGSEEVVFVQLARSAYGLRNAIHARVTASEAGVYTFSSDRLATIAAPIESCLATSSARSLMLSLSAADLVNSDSEYPSALRSFLGKLGEEHHVRGCSIFDIRPRLADHDRLGDTSIMAAVDCIETVLPMLVRSSRCLVETDTAEEC